MNEQDPFNSREFYELCQTYRHTPWGEQAQVVAAFEAIKAFARDQVEGARQEDRL